METSLPSSPLRPIARARTVLTLVVLAALCLPAAASASSTQFTMIQDDGVFLGHNRNHDPDDAVAEAKELGVDAIRVFISWHSVSPNQDMRQRPPGFDVSDPNSAGYQWGLYDGLVERARRHGLELLFVLSPPMPWWASEEPRKCPHRIGGYSRLSLSCMWKPSLKLYAQFVEAAVKRYGTRAEGPYGGQVALWSLWNEPNLEHYLWPQLQRARGGFVDVAAARYRKMWIAGWKAIARHDPPSRNKVLFGETAAISSPMDTIYAALCLDERGMPFKGRMRRLHGCGRVKRLPIAGLALHPYNNFAVGSIFTRSFTKDSLPAAYLGRAHKLLDRAARYRRIPRRRPIYITEFGFQSSPPDPFGEALNPRRHAAAINEAERLFWGDRRVRSFSQYELFDVPSPEDFNTGLRYSNGERKPAWESFRMPLVVSKLRPNLVEIWGMARPANGRARVQVKVAGGALGGSTVRVARTNARGYFRFKLRRARAHRLRYRSEWISDSGETLRSRVASAGRPIKYHE
jgi:hypothetical protein